ncbi:MAG: globin domain-containing protein [Brachybacterium sp.]|nr:globin domain-containing protein [Brachybacterium sp.]MDN5898974.1 globin domain-containing protein [Brachybacterium sp.]
MTVDVAYALHPQLDPDARLAPAHEEAVRATLPLVGAHIDEIAPVFYQRMFSAHPELLVDTFNRGNQAQGAQQKALAASVATYATLLVTPDAPSPREMLGRIGHKHASLGITEDQYGIVHEHLMAAIVEVLGAETITADIAAAWDAVYWHMAGTLIDFEKELYAAAEVAPGDVFREAVVLRRTQESSTVASYVLSAAEGEEPLRDFVPGQYTTVGVRLPDGARQLRQYSLSDAPGEGRWRITVRRLDAADTDPRGEVSSWIHGNLREGDRLQITLPYGDLALDTRSEDPVVLISNGIGITPMLGMLRHLAATQPHRPVRVMHADRDAEDSAHVRELVATLCALPEGADARLGLWFTAAQPADELPGTATGRVRVHAGRMGLQAEHLPEEAEIYLCGSHGFLQNVRGQLEELAVDPEHVHIELFAPNDWLLPAG